MQKDGRKICENDELRGITKKKKMIISDSDTDT
jgi:hypothetical protein